MAWALQQSTLDVQVEAPTEAEMAAFFAKVGGSREQVRSATELGWSNKELTDGDCKVIAHLIAAKFMAVLTTLVLGGNDIGDEGAIAIAEALKVTAVVTTLFLNCNNITDEGAKAIAEALKVNAVVTTLALGGNSIGDEGAIAIAEALKVTEALKVNAVLKNLRKASARFHSRRSHDALCMWGLLEKNARLEEASRHPRSLMLVLLSKNKDDANCALRVALRAVAKPGLAIEL